MDVSEHVSRLLCCVADRPDLGTNEGFAGAWKQLQVEVAREPIFSKDLLETLELEGALKLGFGPGAVSLESAWPTPTQRRVGLKELTSNSDYLSMAVACQLVEHSPENVCNIHSFEQIYGGRILTDIIPEAEHTVFDGSIRVLDHTKEVEKAMRLHVDDADHVLRAPLQVLMGVKNRKATETVIAAVPPNQVLQQNGVETELLRQDLYQHIPPACVEHGKLQKRPVLFGPKDAPGIQADRKNTVALTADAQRALDALFGFLERPENQQHVAILPGDVVILNNVRVLHGRAPLQPVENPEDRRWVKRLWLSSTTMERHLCCCKTTEHSRVFDRQKVFNKAVELGFKHPWHVDQHSCFVTEV